jgi:FkbM family methyltransferase
VDTMDRASSRRSFKSLTNQGVRVRVVDVGANPIDGTPPYRDLLQAGDADVVGFEPNREALAKLNAAKGPHETYLPYAVGDGGRHTLHYCAAPGMTSLFKPNLSVLGLFHGFADWARVVATEEIDTVRLDDIAETEDVDLLKLDIQGAELMVLRHAQARLEHALVVQTEVEFLAMYEGQPLFAELDLFLRARGFSFHRFFPVVSRVIQPLIVDNNIYAGLSQAVWADAIFVRDFTRLDVLSGGQLLRMAAIMQDCYSSYDLVNHLLLEHDRRTGGSLAACYLGELTRSVAAAA